MRTLAIDWGERRVGLALGEESGGVATPLKVLEVSSAAAAVEPLVQLIAKEGVQRLLVGVPLNMDDSVGPSATAAITFGRLLGQRSGAAVVFVDERLSTFGAEQQMADRARQGAHLTRGQKKQWLDSVAAAGLLQAYLDGKLKPLSV